MINQTAMQALADARAAYRSASESADRFRDVMMQVLGLEEKPSDDDLVDLLMAAHDLEGEPESTRFRDLIGTAEMELAEAGFVEPELNSLTAVEERRDSALRSLAAWIDGEHQYEREGCGQVPGKDCASYCRACRALTAVPADVLANIREVSA